MQVGLLFLRTLENISKPAYRAGYNSLLLELHRNLVTGFVHEIGSHHD